MNDSPRASYRLLLLMQFTACFSLSSRARLQAWSLHKSTVMVCKNNLGGSLSLSQRAWRNSLAASPRWSATPYMKSHPLLGETPRYSFHAPVWRRRRLSVTMIPKKSTARATTCERWVYLQYASPLPPLQHAQHARKAKRRLAPEPWDDPHAAVVTGYLGSRLGHPRIDGRRLPQARGGSLAGIRLMGVPDRPWSDDGAPRAFRPSLPA